MCFLLDGFSRSIVHWDIREQMKTADIQTIIEKGTELYPGVKPRIISDNGPQFIARDFKSYIRLKGMDHVRTSPFYPQSNGKIERFHQSIKRECIRPKSPLDLDDAKRLVEAYVHHYNTERLHAGIGYITPKDQLDGRAQRIHAERDRKLQEARAARKAAAQSKNVA
jgi:transposase InsO family protein